MEPRLSRHTTVMDPDGERVTFEAGTVPPEWAQRLITNPSAWEVPTGETVADEDGNEQPVYVSLRDRIESMERRDLIKVAEDEFGLVEGEDFPKSHSKAQITTLLLERAAEAAHDEE
jgi:hypothetical protein